MVRQGFTVIGIDLDSDKIDRIYRGESYISDISSEELAACMETGRFKPTTDYSMIAVIDAVSICVPTPLSENQDPDTSYITMVVDQLKRFMKPNLLITLESTTYPGTTEELIQHRLRSSVIRSAKTSICASRRNGSIHPTAGSIPEIRRRSSEERRMPA